ASVTRRRESLGDILPLVTWVCKLPPDKLSTPLDAAVAQVGTVRRFRAGPIASRVQLRTAATALHPSRVLRGKEPLGLAVLVDWHQHALGGGFFAHRVLDLCQALPNTISETNPERDPHLLGGEPCLGGELRRVR